MAVDCAFAGAALKETRATAVRSFDTDALYIIPRLVKILSCRVENVLIPLKRPFVTALGRKNETGNAVLRLKCSGGIEGYGEASSSLAMAHLSPEALSKALTVLGRAAVGRDVEESFRLIRKAWKRFGHCRPAAAAFESALLDAWTQSHGLSLRDWLGAKLEMIRSDVTLSAWDCAAAKEAAREAAREGFTDFKVKLTGEHAADLSRVRAVAASARRPKLILDGNQGMSMQGALKLIEACLQANIRPLLLEQPLPKTDFKGMASLTKRSPIPIAADEMVGSPEEAVRLAQEGAAHVINIKLAKSGLLGGLAIAAVARAARLRLMIGCMMESAAGLSASVHMALGTGAFDFIDLDSDYLLQPGIAPRGWNRRGPKLSAD